MAERFYRKVIRICATDSPNVRLALLERSQGKVPSNHIILPGVLPWADYAKRRSTWDNIRQCIGLDAQFYEGAEVLMFPPEWLNHSEARAEELLRDFGSKRTAEAIGIDPGEGVANTSMCAIDRYGILELVSKKTPNTTQIVNDALAFIRKHQVPAHAVCFDRGGGGKQHADRLREDHGLNVRTVAFGESVTLDMRRGITPFSERFDNREERYVYVNRRAEMYWTLHMFLDPSQEDDIARSSALNGPVVRGVKTARKVFAIPAQYTLLRSELAPIPTMYDGEGRIKMLPKNKRDPNSDEKTLTELIGHSPDEADALVLAVHALTYKQSRIVAGAV